jgi:uncharacterized iron-regulated protein
MRPPRSLLAPLLAALLLAGCATPHPPVAPVAAPPEGRWVDLARGVELTPAAVFADLASAGVILVGEIHDASAHHRAQRELLQGLFARGVPLVLCLEHLEAGDQPAVDRYQRGELTFADLAREIDWTRKWSNHADYRGLCEFARVHGIPIRGVNAPAELIRTVHRGGGIARLAPADRAALPADLHLDDPAYERMLRADLAAHPGLDPAALRPLFEAQVARDETLAAGIVAARADPGGAPRTAFAVLGAAHLRHGLGTAERIRRRAPGVTQRLVLLGPAPATAPATAEARTDLATLGRLPGDYLWLPGSRPAPALPPGHPPLPSR